MQGLALILFITLALSLTSAKGQRNSCAANACRGQRAINSVSMGMTKYRPKMKKGGFDILRIDGR